MEVREVLEGMLDVLHEKEWIKDQMYSAREGEVVGVCLEGACNMVMVEGGVSMYEDFLSLKSRVTSVIIKAAAQTCPEFADWMTAMFQFNDWEPVTREDVILAVKTALEGS